MFSGCLEVILEAQRKFSRSKVAQVERWPGGLAQEGNLGSELLEVEQF